MPKNTEFPHFNLNFKVKITSRRIFCNAVLLCTSAHSIACFLIKEFNFIKMKLDWWRETLNEISCICLEIIDSLTWYSLCVDSQVQMKICYSRRIVYVKIEIKPWLIWKDILFLLLKIEMETSKYTVRRHLTLHCCTLIRCCLVVVMFVVL